MKTSGCLWIGGIGAIAGVMVLAQIGDSVESEFEAQAVSETDGGLGAPGTDEAENRAPAAPRSDWTYREQRDELRGATDYFAQIDSANMVEFGFPYGGPQPLHLTVRKSSAHGSDVIFSIPSGQFVCGVYDCQGMISFDGQPEKLTLSTSADHDSAVVFATYGDAIIRKLKSADKVIVELPFYQEGNRQFTFNTAGLDWDH